MGQRVVPSPFLTKTYDLVEDVTTNDVVSWNQSGTAFVVWKTADLAKDLLPNYFKHNNFSSFVRQLNTYGFRKVVPDKWEFANENFRRGQKELLTKIRRRKNVTSSQAGKPTAPAGPLSAPSVSGDDLGSSSTSSPDSKSPESVETPTRFAYLSDENGKLRKDNENLSCELVQTKKQCEELVAFLTQCLKVEPDQINRIMRQGSCGPNRGSTAGTADDGDEDDDDDDEKEGENLKLFGVWLKGEKKKRRRDEKIDFYGVQRKEIKTVDFQAPWMMMMMSLSSGETNKVCN